MTLKSKFLLFFAFGAAGAMLAVAMVGYFFTKEQLIHSARSEMSAQLDIHSARTDGWIKSKIRILETTGTLLRNTVPNQAVKTEHLLGYRLDPDVSNLYLGLEDGRFLNGADWTPKPDYDPRKQDWYEQAKDKVGITVTTPYLDNLANRQVVSFVLPLRNAFGKLRGVLGAEVQLAALSNYTRNVNLFGAGYAFLLDKNGVFIAHPDQSLLGSRLQEQGPFKPLATKILSGEEGSETFTADSGRQLLMFRKLPTTGWTLAITVPEADVYKELTAMKIQFAVTTALVITLLVFITLLIYHHFVAPLVELGQKALKVAEGDLLIDAIPLPKGAQDEFGLLTSSFNEMIANVSQREKARIKQLEEGTQELLAVNQRLQTSNNDLNATLEQLRQAQGQLIEAEKMAALGNLVAGIAHEINTPIGVGVTAASHLAQITETFLGKYEGGNLSRQALNDYLADSGEAAKILLANLERAAKLVSNLKQVSTDQSSETVRTFKVGEYLKEILLSLHPRLKKTKHTIEIDCPDDLELTTYAGAFAQVIINLVMNSLTHAFPGNSAGNIKLTFSRQKNQLSFMYSDNGSGMDNLTLSRIYEPFFTTKREQGGTGLGLYLLYNIVVQQLKGSVTCCSAPGEGAVFNITLPLDLPESTT